VTMAVPSGRTDKAADDRRNALFVRFATELWRERLVISRIGQLTRFSGNVWVSGEGAFTPPVILVYPFVAWPNSARPAGISGRCVEISLRHGDLSWCSRPRVSPPP